MFYFQLLSTLHTTTTLIAVIAATTGLFITALPTAHAQTQTGNIPLRLELSSAWDGNSRPGSTTEITVKLLAAHGGTVNLKINNGTRITEIIAIQLEPGKTKKLQLPMRIHRQNKISIQTASKTYRSTSASLALQLHHTNSAIIAVTVFNNKAANKFFSSDTTTLLHPAISELPRHTQAYSSIDALILDAEKLFQMDDQQLNALSSFLQSCGRLAVTGLSQHAAKPLTDNAGCNGRFFSVTNTYPQAFSWINKMLNLTPDPLPTATQLSHLINYEPAIHDHQNFFPSKPANQATYTWGIFILIYFLLLFIATKINNRPALITSVPVFTAVIIIVIGLTAKPETQAIYWTEAFSENQHARFSMLLRTTGAGAQQTHINFPLEQGLPESLSKNNANPWLTSYENHEQNNASIALELDTHLFSQDDFYWQGSFQYQAPLTLAFQAGIPSLENLNSQTSQSGILRWENNYYAVPALAPAAQWSPQHNNHMPASSPSVVLANKLVSGNDTALLIPYIPTKRQQLISKTHGWLLIRERPLT